MSSSYVFTGASLHVLSVTPISSSRVRLTFSQAPLRINPAGANDSLNATNYIISGPEGRSITTVDTVVSDLLSVDLNVSAALISGTWTVTVSNVKTSGGVGLSAPLSGAFTVSQIQTSLTAGAESEDAYTVIRKHLNAALDGVNWQALIHALSEADQYIWELAQNAFDQLFLTSASGKYLRRKASDSGIQEYPGLGMSDDQFRDLAIKLSTGRVTYISILEILESYYGPEALRAYADTQNGPFALADGQTVVFKIENTEYIYEVDQDDFRVVATATASELAVALTNFFTKKGSSAYAAVKVDPVTGTEFVRVFSGALGLKSSLSIVGGTAQPFLGFDTYKDVYTGTVVPGDGYSWVYSLTSTGKTQIRFTHTVNSVIPKIDTATVVAGDYVVIGTDTSTNGWYEIESATFEWVAGPLYRQTIVLTENIGFTGTIVQQSNSSYKFYTPTNHLVSNGSRTVVVSQTVPNILEVQVPATADVSRTAGTAAYIVGNTQIPITSIERKNGTVTVQTSTAHGLTANRQVEISNFVPALGRSWVFPANATNLGSSFVHALASTANMTGSATDISASSPIIETLSTGDVIVAGGYDDTGAAYAHTLKLATASTLLGGTTQAVGAKDTTYTFTALGNMPVAKWDAGHSVLSGPMLDQILSSGGLNTAGTILSSAEKLTGAAWAAVSSMGTARALHQQITLNDGNVLVSGGIISSYETTASCELYQPLYDSWIPVAAMNVPRHSHKLHKLSDGKILAIGGFSMGQPTPTLPNIVGQWRFDTLAVTTPDVGGTYNLTTTGTIATAGKVNNSLAMTGIAGDPATFAANATLRDTFAMTNGVGMSIDFWVKGFGTGTKALVYYENTVAAVAADNAIFRLYESAANTLAFEYQNGVLNTVGPTNVGTIPTAFMNGWNHIAVTGTPDGVGNVTYRFYINGVAQTPITGAMPSGGSNSFFSVGGSPLSGNIWAGNFDDMRLWSRPLSAGEVAQQYLQGAGYTKYGTNRKAEAEITVRRALNSVEVYDPALNTWTLVSSMGSNRGLFESLTLDNGEILVLGGLGYPVGPVMPITTPIPGGSATSIWPLARLSSVEIYNPTTGKWRIGPTLPSPKGSFWTARVANKLYIGDVQYGYNFSQALNAYSVPTDTNIYWLDLTDFTYGILPAIARTYSTGNLRDWGVGLTSGVAIMGGVKAGGAQTRYVDAIIGDAAIGAKGGINGFHNVASVISPTAFTFTTENQFYTSSLGMDKVLRPVSASFAFADALGNLTHSAASRVSNVTTVTITVPVGTLSVFINSNDANFSSGLKLLTARTSTTISYAEVAADNAGNVFVSSPFTIPTSESVDAAGTDGIFILDPTRWTQLSGESTVSTAMVDGTAYSIIDVSSTSSFPDSVGYVVLGLGTGLESKPLKYLEKISTTQLLMQGFTADHNWPVGTTVTLVSLTASESIANSFWLTGALAAQLAAERDVKESVADDIDLNWSVVYPGDRGLGGEGADNSDAPIVWGPDLFNGGF